MGLVPVLTQCLVCLGCFCCPDRRVSLHPARRSLAPSRVDPAQMEPCTQCGDGSSPPAVAMALCSEAWPKCSHGYMLPKDSGVEREPCTS